MTKPNDSELVASYREGDLAAFEQLVGRWTRRIQDLACRLLGDPDEARDVCQMAFIRLWSAPDAFRGQARFSTWFTRIALNLCRDRLRSRRSREKALAGRGEPDPAEASTGTGFERGDTALRVARAVRELPGSLREVVILKHYEGLSFEQLAEILGIPASTAKSRMGRALDWLRNQLEELRP